MLTSASGASFIQIDERPLNRRQKGLITAAVLGTMLEFFDFFIVAFVLTMISEPWQLTYGESAFMLLTAGVGAILGSIAFGALADRYGRRRIFVTTILVFSIATGALAIVPEGGWLLFGLLRLVVGFGVGGLIVVDVPLVQEFVPAHRRGFLGALVVVFVPVGTLLGSAGAAFLGPVVGWRGLVLLGLLPALVSIYVRVAVPESPTWLIRQGRPEEARRSVAWILDIKPEEVILPGKVESTRTRWRDMFRYRRSVGFTWLNSLAVQLPYYGASLWGPTLIAMQLGVTPARAAFLYLFVSLSGFLGRVLGARASDRFGRRRTGFIAMTGASAAMILIAVLPGASVGGVALFYPILLIGWAFMDASFAVGLPFWSEMFPAHIRASGVGAAYGFGGLGKIVGPAALAVISGAGTALTPAATAAAITPAFWFFAVFTLIAAGTYVWPALETKGKSLDEIEELHTRQLRGRNLAVRNKTEPLAVSDRQ
ncbi:MFS transporter [Lentzea albidocapillata]|uniref:MFS transporter, putative metabolite:H+ symporter n=1 Tax=Lentzea albidocapillata TaxID=40571 RepID=A0A1W2FTW0_9PSEU|nr:MFS transporter [Lentzea albidocapillata]SMD25214.1 MFS transporter, putative metabolite:H+ symporter [Lentzea albidocapillata]